MNKMLFGYQIGSDVQLDVFNKQMVNYGNNHNAGKPHRIKLRDTKLRLLIFLLDQPSGSTVMNKKIMFNVWDKYGLRSSAPRLWQVMQDLKLTLSIIGVDDNFITKVENKGYRINTEIVTTLYCDKVLV